MTTEDFLKGVIQLKGLGYKGVIITSDLLDNNQITENPGLFEGVFGSQVADPATPETSHYINLYKNLSKIVGDLLIFTVFNMSFLPYLPSLFIILFFYSN
jgi:hypothetical protein